MGGGGPLTSKHASVNTSGHVWEAKTQQSNASRMVMELLKVFQLMAYDNWFPTAPICFNASIFI